MALISVDLPAPLSPTKAVTSPVGTSRSTSVRACTGPKLLVIFSRRSRGVAGLWASATASAGTATSLLDAVGGAGGLGVRHADVGDLHGLVLDDRVLDVGDRDPCRRQVGRLHVAVGRGVLGGRVHQARRRRLTGPQVKGDGSGRLSLEVDRLVHGAALEALED